MSLPAYSPSAAGAAVSAVESPISTSSRLPTLDGVRGLAILLVVTHNLNLLSAPQGLVAHLVTSGLDRGWIGVQLFFVLSGFLITGILLDTRSAPNYFKSFFARRVLRIFPVYYATLLLMFVILPALDIWHGFSLRDYPHQLWVTVFMSNWTEPFHVGQGSLPHFWSLAVEEQFYLLWPFVVYRCNPSQVIKVSAVIAVVALLVRWAMVIAEFPDEAVYSFTICRMDALALGAIGAAVLRLPTWRDWSVNRQSELTWAGVVVLFVGALLSYAYTETGPSAEILGYSFLAAGLGILVLVAACADISGARGWPSLLRGAWLRRFGLYSYGMYVLHVPLREVIGMPLLRAFGLEDHSSLALSLVYIALGTLVSFVVAAASYHFFEVHFLRLKRFFKPAASEPVR